MFASTAGQAGDRSQAQPGPCFGRDHIPDLILRAQQAGAHHHVLLLQAAYQRRISLLIAPRGTTARQIKTFMAAARGPALILLGDDDYRTTGPDGWPAHRRVLAWAAQVVVHGSGADPAEYAALVVAAGLIGRVLLIETSSDAAVAWMEAAERHAPRTAPKIGVRPLNGGRHPVQHATGAVQ